MNELTFFPIVLSTMGGILVGYSILLTTIYQEINNEFTTFRSVDILPILDYCNVTIMN